MSNGSDDRLTERVTPTAASAAGYSTEQCLTCYGFTLVPHGTGLKCDTCGAESGTSPLTVLPVADALGAH